MSFHSRALSLIILPIMVTACATSGKSTLTGMGVGAGLGAGVGALAEAGPGGQNRIRNVFIGATAGSVAGAGAGYLLHNSKENAEKDAYEKGKKEGSRWQDSGSSGANQPTLIPAKVDARFVDDSVRGNVFVPAHFEYVIIEPARWSRE